MGNAFNAAPRMTVSHNHLSDDLSAHRVHTIHQYWDSSDLGACCSCSSSSWRYFAETFGWSYKLWTREAFLNATHSSSTNIKSLLKYGDLFTTDRKQSLFRGNTFRLWVLHTHGGLYVDCDLLWVGAQAPVPGDHKPTRELVHALAHVNSLAFTHHPPDQTPFDPVRRPLGYDGKSHHYFNNAARAHAPNSY
jgi:mannosyltransferase OCH1-like enzyme